MLLGEGVIEGLHVRLHGGGLQLGQLAAFAAGGLGQAVQILKGFLQQAGILAAFQLLVEAQEACGVKGLAEMGVEIRHGVLRLLADGRLKAVFIFGKVGAGLLRPLGGGQVFGGGGVVQGVEILMVEEHPLAKAEFRLQPGGGVFEGVVGAAVVGHHVDGHDHRQADEHPADDPQRRSGQFHFFHASAPPFCCCA